MLFLDALISQKEDVIKSNEMTTTEIPDSSVDDKGDERNSCNVRAGMACVSDRWASITQKATVGMIGGDGSFGEVCG